LIEGHPFPAPHMLIASGFKLIAAAINRPLTGYAQVTMKS
jgi:hypothetical protein